MYGNCILYSGEIRMEFPAKGTIFITALAIFMWYVSVASNTFRGTDPLPSEFNNWDGTIAYDAAQHHIFYQPYIKSFGKCKYQFDKLVSSRQPVSKIRWQNYEK